MKKATTKRERKFGKKNDDGVKTTKATEDRVVKVMVDYAMIMKFKNMKQAQIHIDKEHKEADKSGRQRASFIIV